MSFLLDALRKSEKQRRLGDVPNIHSATETESRLLRNPGLKPILLTLLAAFLGLAWFGWVGAGRRSNRPCRCPTAR